MYRLRLKGWPGLLLLAAAAQIARADRMSLVWDPMAHPLLSGYRVHVRELAGSFTQDLDVPENVTAATVNGLNGGCRTYCASVRALGDGGLVGPASAEVCGYPDPEVLDVAFTGEDWRVLGDNLAADVQAFLDGSGQPVGSARTECGTLFLDEAPILSLRVHNVSDGAGVVWQLPYAGYLEPSNARGVVVLECDLDADLPAPTVSRLSHTPGLALGVEADLPGVGTDCAEAVGAVLELPGMGPIKMTVLPRGTGFVYLFVN
jgi:hypothetical protein